MAKRGGLVKDTEELKAAIEKHCSGFCEDDKQKVSAAALFDAAKSTASMDEIVKQIVSVSAPEGKVGYFRGVKYVCQHAEADGLPGWLGSQTHIEMSDGTLPPEVAKDVIENGETFTMCEACADAFEKAGGMGAVLGQTQRKPLPPYKGEGVPPKPKPPSPEVMAKLRGSK